MPKCRNIWRDICAGAKPRVETEGKTYLYNRRTCGESGSDRLYSIGVTNTGVFVQVKIVLSIETLVVLQLCQEIMPCLFLIVFLL